LKRVDRLASSYLSVVFNKKRLIIASVAGFFLILLIACSVAVMVASNNTQTSSGSNSHQKNTGSSPEKEPKKEKEEKEDVPKIVQKICNTTKNQKLCTDTLSKEKGKSPKELVKAAITAVDDEIQQVLAKAGSFKLKNPKEEAAFEDCRELMADAREELDYSAITVTNDGKMNQTAPELNNWLSAVMSYQQTCIDGFPDGQTKTDMEKAFNKSKQLTSNSLAMVDGLASFIASIENAGAAASRHLLAEKPSVHADGLPSWMNPEARRILKAAEKKEKPKPNVTVAKDGSGDFKTITEALAALPRKYEGRYVIFVKEGIYDETVTVDKKMVNITMYGDGSKKTIVTGNKNFVDGVQTFRTATFVVLGEGFVGQAMGFRNTAGPEKHQAVALRVQADRSIFLNCRFEGYQDTLYVQTHRQFYRSCVIVGTVDFIFGDAAVIIQNSQIIVRKPLDNQQNIVTAQGRVDEHEHTAIVLQNCRIEPDTDLVPVKEKIKSYLGRPWKDYSRTIVMESTIEDIIHPDGWLPWEGEKGLKTLYYAEFNNKGAGSKTTSRVKWPGYHVITKSEAEKFTVGSFYEGEWITATGSPVHFGLY
ncbi:hypothetical protein Tsubulata_026172, partial [Turnera subulata]